MFRYRSLAFGLPLVLLLGAAAAPAAPPAWHIPTAVHRLDNGLTVVVSQDASTPAVGVAVIYGVGFRVEPQGRTGFAHLFEHLMFQGTPKVPGELFGRIIQQSGGLFNGSTYHDYTRYIAMVPSAALERLLWLEADRMSGLALTPESLANQKEVVKEEIRLKVQNRPYGQVTWIDLPGQAFERWENAHDGFGSFVDLDAATLEDARAFHRTYYSPGNAVVSLVGDVEPEKAFAFVEKYFGAIPAQPLPPLPQLDEKLGPGEKWLEQPDAFARIPKLVVGWRMPPPESGELAAGALLAEVLAGGEASRLARELVREESLAESAAGGIYWPLGDFFNVRGPTLLTLSLRYPAAGDGRALATAIDREVAELVRDGLEDGELERARARYLAGFYDELELFLERAEVLGVRQLFTGDAASINEIPKQLLGVGEADLRRFAATYLTVANRSVIDRRPAAPSHDETTDEHSDEKEAGR